MIPRLYLHLILIPIFKYPFLCIIIAVLNVSVDGHYLWVLSMDGEATVPLRMSNVLISAGQRIDVALCRHDPALKTPGRSGSGSLVVHRNPVLIPYRCQANPLAIIALTFDNVSMDSCCRGHRFFGTFYIDVRSR